MKKSKRVSKNKNKKGSEQPGLVSGAEQIENTEVATFNEEPSKEAVDVANEPEKVILDKPENPVSLEKDETETLLPSEGAQEVSSTLTEEVKEDLSVKEDVKADSPVEEKGTVSLTKDETSSPTGDAEAVPVSSIEETEEKDQGKKKSKRERDKEQQKKSEGEKPKQQSYAVKQFLMGSANWVGLLPIALVLSIVPLIVFLKVLPLEPEIDAYWSSAGVVYDFFSYYKSLAVIGLAGVSLVFMALFRRKDRSRKDILLRFAFALVAVYLAFSLISTVIALYPGVAIWGAPDRREGMIVLLAYAVLFMYAITSYRSEKNRKIIFWSLSFLMLVTTVMGISQFFGQDLLQTPGARSFILPPEYQNATLSFQFEKEKIYGTMFHYNYMGSFGAMMVPFFLVIALFSKEIFRRIVAAILAICALFVLFGSTSRAGIVGLALVVVFFLFVLLRQLFRYWRISLTTFTILLAAVAIFSIATQGAIFARIPTLLEDLGIAGGVQQNFDYHDHVPIRAISVDGKQLFLRLQGEHMLVVDNTTGNINLFDEKMELLPYEKGEDKIYRTSDTRFADFSYSKGKIKRTINRTEEIVDVLLLKYLDQDVLILNLSNPSEIRFYTPKFYEFTPKDAPYIGFEGKEKIGSARGYIWSRSLPLLKDTIIAGYGPDTYMLHFPQGDILAKWYAYGTPNMTVDKPHNWYLQVAINQGLVALAALLVLLLLYVIDSILLYAFRKEYSETEVFAIGLFLAVIGYMGAGFFNDSVVSVAPVFWCLLGLGFGANSWVRRLRKEEA